MPIDMQKIENWSKLTDKPVIYYNKEYAEWMACWNGIHMTGRQAFAIALNQFCGVLWQPSVCYELSIHFWQLYYANAFGNRQWDNKHNTITHLQLFLLRNHLDNMRTKYPPACVITWFEQMLSGDTNS